MAQAKWHPIGKLNPFYGKTHNAETKEKMRLAKLGKAGSETNHWKGEQVGYMGLHHWIRKQFGKAQYKECVYCGSNKNLQWANVSHEYKRNLEDWIPLCAKCHSKYDDNINKGWITRRRNQQFL